MERYLIKFLLEIDFRLPRGHYACTAVLTTDSEHTLSSGIKSIYFDNAIAINSQQDINRL